MTNRDNLAAGLRDPNLTDTETRALLCHIVRTCRREGVQRLRLVVCDGERAFFGEPVFQADR